MSARETFQFAQKYILRPAGLEDLDSQLAELWTEADPDHRGRVQPNFWLEQGDGRDSFLFLDDEGPLFFFKMILLENRAVEIHIQFPPEPAAESYKYKRYRRRTAQGLADGLAWLETMMRRAEVREMFFDSTNPALTSFAIRRLGFVMEGEKLRKRLA